MVGIPNPPLRMMAPSGAPTKKKSKQASDRVIRWCHSTSCLRTKYSWSCTVSLRHDISVEKFCNTVAVRLRARSILSLGIFANKLSKLTGCRFNSRSVAKESLRVKALVGGKARPAKSAEEAKAAESICRFIESMKCSSVAQFLACGIKASSLASSWLKLESKSMSNCLYINVSRS